jgi:hypothetical protein
VNKLCITHRPITELRPAPYNPRDIQEGAFYGLMESLKKFGLVDPLIVNKRTGLMVGGHQRLKAAEALGWTEVPTVEVDLSPAEEKALNVTLNNQKISGTYTDALQELLEEIQADVDFPDDDFAKLKFDDLVIPGWGEEPPKKSETEYGQFADEYNGGTGVKTMMLAFERAEYDSFLPVIKVAMSKSKAESVKALFTRLVSEYVDSPP